MGRSAAAAGAGGVEGNLPQAVTQAGNRSGGQKADPRGPFASYTVLRRITGVWSRLSLFRRFAATGGLVMLAAMAIIGSWVSQRIEEGVVRNSGIATALYMDSFVAPVSQELDHSDSLSPEAAKALEGSFADTPLGERVVSYKIWKSGGRIVHSSRPEHVGKVFGETPALRAAWRGEVTAEFNNLRHDEDAAERATGRPLLEIYSPIRAAWSDKVIAVAEFYEAADELEAELFAARLNSWIVVAAVMISTAFLLFGIVLSGSRTIDRQRRVLEAQVADLAKLSEQNDRLRQRMQRAAGRVTELNERFLRRISAELHDGPAQLLGFASLRLRGAAHGGPERSTAGRDSDGPAVREALDQAMQQIRDLCRGLALPDLDAMPLGQVVRQAIDGHQTLTGTEVSLRDRVEDGLEVPHSQKICVFRFLNEALANAFRHAGGEGQKVTLHDEDGWLKVRVSDSGPGFGPFEPRPAGSSGLGLAGLRERVESLGGTFIAVNGVHGGAVLTMRLPLNAGG